MYGGHTEIWWQWGFWGSVVIGMRWHMVLVVPVALLSSLALLGGLAGAALIGYYNVRYGPIADSGGEYEALDGIALSIKNILRINVLLALGTMGLMTARYLYQARRREALIAGAFVFVLGFLSAMISSR
jgi:hypothetical protein